MTDQLTNDFDVPAFSRRTFMAGSAGALFVFTLQSGMKPGIARAAGMPTAVNGTIAIDDANNIVVTYPIAEMGQGTMTGLAQCVAEEMVADWAKVKTVAADWAHSGFTGGSMGLRTNWMTMRTSGAKALDMLRQAAADSFGVSASDAGLQPNGRNQFAYNGATRDYKDLVAAAATKAPTASPTLVPQANWRIMGSSKARLDIPSKVDGSAVFGMDVQLPNMLYAAVRQSPVIGGTIGTTPSTPTGATAVFRLAQLRTTSTYTAVAVVADNSWLPINFCSKCSNETSAASTWRSSLKWTSPAGASAMTSTTIRTAAANLLAATTITQTAEDIGTAAATFAAAAKQVDATYEIPYLAHVMMEVPNCTVRLAADLSTIEVWAPTQNPGPYTNGAVATIKDRLSRAGLTVPDSGITVNPTLVGGGFGRKFDHDFLDHAVQVAIGLRAKGINRPVKLYWPRTEDFSHDQYRPMALMRVRVGMDSSGTPTAYFLRHVSQSPLKQRGLFFGAEGDNVDGAIDTAYAIPNKRVEYARLDSVTVPVGWWRSVGESMNVFAVESAIDEAAALAGVDPLTFRQRMLTGRNDILAVLNSAANMIDWTTPVAGRGKGIALSTGFGSLAAVAAEVSDPGTGVMRIERLAICVDPGVAINPNQVRAQMEGGLIMGISSARWGKVTFASGVASATNFGSGVQVAKFADVPPISVDILQSGARDSNGAGGVGEVGVPAVAPALANAWARLKGEAAGRKRTLPLG